VEVSRSLADRDSLGNVHFSAKMFVKNTHGISDLFRSGIYKSPVLPPAMTWLTYPSPPTPSNVKTHGQVVSWNTDSSGHARSWAIFQIIADVYNLVAVLQKDSASYTLVDIGHYVLVSVNRIGIQSKEISFTIMDTIPVIG
jgi:hypothetical protein